MYRDSAYYFLYYNYLHNNCKSSKVGLKKKIYKLIIVPITNKLLYNNDSC